ncbi:MAG: MAPEG family protein [Betaproteobacteria bacterium]
MTIAYWCVLAAAVLPIIWAGVAKSRGDFDNRSPREWLARREGWRLRANWAQANAWEAFAPFAAAVIIAHLAGARPAIIDALALTFIAARIAHGVLYVTDRSTLRTIVWTIGYGCVVGLFVASV